MQTSISPDSPHQAVNIIQVYIYDTDISFAWPLEWGLAEAWIEKGGVDLALDEYLKLKGGEEERVIFGA
jgi:hypothetical protein